MDEMQGVSGAVRLLHAMGHRRIAHATMPGYDDAGQLTYWQGTLNVTVDLTNAEEVRRHIGVWQGCLSLFGQFNADPVRFLARS